MENLTLIGKDQLCHYYRNANRSKEVHNLILKDYVGEKGNALRELNVFSKSLVWEILRNDIEESYQRRIVALSEIPNEDQSLFLGRVLFIRSIDRLPFDCILSGHDAVFSNGKMLKMGQTVNLLREWFLTHEQYDIASPAAFLFNIREKSLHVSEIMTEYFKERKLRLLYFKINLGIEIDECSNEAIPIWTGEGVIPQTANILQAGELIKDPKHLARIILPPSVFKKEIGED